PAVDGRGIQILREAGLDVFEGERGEDAARINVAFLQHVQRARPFVTAKWAMTLDGKTASARGDSRWISTDAARQFVHLWRDASDAIVVGLGTVLADNPSLTVRLPTHLDVRAPRLNPPWRVVLDSQARTPTDSRLVASNLDRRTLILVGEAAPNDRVDALLS